MSVLYEYKEIKIELESYPDGSVTLTINGSERDYKSLEAAAKALYKFTKGQKI